MTTAEVAVGETWKGTVGPKRRVFVVQTGGELDGYVTHVHGQATFTPGERAVFFLKGTEESSTVIGMGQGKRPLRFDKQRGWIIDSGDRSAAVELDGQGGMRPVGQAAAAKLDELREQVRALGGR